MTVCATLKDGRVIAKATLTETSRASLGMAYTSATIAELRNVEEVLQVNLTSTVEVSPQNATISGNVVGLSVYLGASGGVTGNVLVLGY